jgi:CheY-like chemotaxis protein
VQTGLEALEFVQQPEHGSRVPVDVILKDHDPPNSNALRFLKKLRESNDEKLRTLPVVGEARRDFVVSVAGAPSSISDIVLHPKTDPLARRTRSRVEPMRPRSRVPLPVSGGS